LADRVVRVSLTAQVSNYLAGMEKARKATQDAGSEAERAARAIEQQNQAMQSAGRGLLVVGAVAVAATALSVKAAIGWETAWTGVTKTVEGTPAELAKVEEGLRSLAKTLPASHEQIAAVAEAAGQLGIKTASVTAFTKTMIDLGETTNLSAEEAAMSLARFMNVMGTSQDDVERLGSAIVELGNNYATTEAEIVAMASRLSGAGRQIGLSEAQVLGLATALSSVDIEAEAGGSAFSKVMIDIASNVANSGEKLELFAKTAGVSAREFSNQWKTDPGAALELFVLGLANAESQGSSTLQVLEELGITEVRMRDALLKSAGASGKFSEAMATGTKAFEENNALAEEAAKRYATVESQLQVMNNRVKDAAISFGEVFLPAVSAAAEGIGDFADLLGDMDPVLQSVLAAVVLLGGGVAVTGGIFLLAIPKIAAYQATLQILALSTMPSVAASAVAMQGKIAASSAALGRLGTFLGGPWGVAIAAAAVGLLLLKKYIDDVGGSADSISNKLSSVKSASEVFETFGGGTTWVLGQDIVGQLNDMDHLIASLDARASNGFEWLNVFSDTGSSMRFAIDNIRKIGEEISKVADSDLPEAQRQFRLLADETDGSAKAQGLLLDAMPDYKKALEAQSAALGVDAQSSDEAANKTQLLKLALGQVESPAHKAADAYLAAADEASGLQKDIDKLVESINIANGVGQDAVTSNATYQASLEGLSGEIQAQKEAFEEANGTLDGFTASLDESTAVGSANAAMLAGLAGDAQTAAAAQYEVDLKTMGAKDATDKYVETLAVSKQAIIDQAIENGLGGEALDKLIAKVYEVPDQKKTKMLIDTAQATKDINDWVSIINGKRISIAVGQGGAGGITRAEGGILPGVPSATDNMFIHAASGEFVTNAKSTADPANRRALEFMNNGGTISGYANGGMVRPQYVSSSGGGGSSYSTTGDTFNASFQLAPAAGRSISEQAFEAARRMKIRR
jgi:TP901 family phage tail tape measure protein